MYLGVVRVCVPGCSQGVCTQPEAHTPHPLSDSVLVPPGSGPGPGSDPDPGSDPGPGIGSGPARPPLAACIEATPQTAVKPPVETHWGQLDSGTQEGQTEPVSKVLCGFVMNITSLYLFETVLFLRIHYYCEHGKCFMFLP